MPTMPTEPPARVTIEGATKLVKSAKLAAALLPNLLEAAEELEVARTLGKSNQELAGEIAGVFKAERSKTLAIELLSQGVHGAEVARQTGLTPSRISQLKRDTSPELRRAVTCILDFLDAHDASSEVCNAIDMIATPAARKMLIKVSDER